MPVKIFGAAAGIRTAGSASAARLHSRSPYMALGGRKLPSLGSERAAEDVFKQSELVAFGIARQSTSPGTNAQRFI